MCHISWVEQSPVQLGASSVLASTALLTSAAWYSLSVPGGNCQHGRYFISYFRCGRFLLELLLPCRGGEARVLISTDVWARGLDVQQVSVCITELSPQ